MKITHRFNLNYRLWQGWGWAVNLFWGLSIAAAISLVTASLIASDIVYKLAAYLAASPIYYGLPFYFRLGILGGGVVLLSSVVIATALAVARYKSDKITLEDLDIQLTAIYSDLRDIKERGQYDN